MISVLRSRIVSRQTLLADSCPGNSLVCQQVFGACLLICLLLTGCGVEKESLFEEEHDLPAHWPSGLVDAATKIDQRISRLASVVGESKLATEENGSEQCESELRDLVEWIPEVAADTDLSESQWLPIYELCEVMREHLSRSDVSASDIEEDFRRLQALLVESAQLLPSLTDTPLAEEPASVLQDATESASSDIIEAPTRPGDKT
ncbi:hypothetical protein [Aureliella helgolandensis]|uniref:Uncharacterized protein n=1 Tax=Aureliella helgolandensis TaxID=2527968 RepID=A0A518G3M7_9BACT|nr:hypothetical protein [Aureliella helgolandensis]QDV23198.1 hypothetical protein Q31a_14960 [Aureliella helgolandensis]